MPIDKVKKYALLAAHSYPKRRILDEESQVNKFSKQLKNHCNKNVISISINDLNSLIALKKLLLSEKNKNKKLDTGKWQP